MVMDAQNGWVHLGFGMVALVFSGKSDTFALILGGIPRAWREQQNCDGCPLAHNYPFIRLNCGHLK